MSRIKQPIKPLKVYSTDNGGLALTSEGEQWFKEVTEAINFLLNQDIAGVDQLAALILKVNRLNHK